MQSVGLAHDDEDFTSGVQRVGGPPLDAVQDHMRVGYVHARECEMKRGGLGTCGRTFEEKYWSRRWMLPLARSLQTHCECGPDVTRMSIVIQGV